MPVAFHVDYWDYIGWKDRFAMPGYSEGQRRYARRGNINTVYTPGFVLNGEEWRGWFRSKPLNTQAGAPVSELRVEIEEGQTRVSFSPVVARSEPTLELQVAILGFDITTKVKAGENHGRTLTHNFVEALGEPIIEKQTQYYAADFALPVPKIRSPVMALVAWVSPPGGGQPIQAVGGWLP